MASERSHWGTITAFGLVSAANQMLWLNFAPITTGAATRLGVSSSTVGLLSEVFPLTYVLLAVPVGRALDHWFRPTLLIGAAGTAVGALLRLVGHGFAPILIGQVVVALAQPAVLSAVTGVAARAATEKDRVMAIAAGSAGTFLGFVMAFVLGLAYGPVHLRALMEVSAAVAVAGAVLLFSSSRPLARRPTLTEARGQTRLVWSDPAVRVICVVAFLGFGVFVAVTTWAQTLMEHHGVSTRAADGLLLVMVGLGIAGAAVVPDWVARRDVQPVATGVAAGGGGLACLVLAFAPGVVTGYLALGLFGLVLLPALPVMLELLEKRHPEASATATGLLWLAGNAGGIVVALAVQGVIHHPTVAWLMMAAGAVIALPLSRRLAQALRMAAPAPG